MNYEKGVRSILETNGVVAQVSDAEILLAKQAIDRSGLGCEPASACTLAGIRKLVTDGVIRNDESVVAILTGHVLKDSEIIFSHHSDISKAVCEIDPQIEAVQKAL